MEIILLDRSNTLLDIITVKDIINLDFEEILNDYWKWSFELTIDKSNKIHEYLKPNNRVVIRHNNKLMFGWHIYWMEPTYNLTNRFFIRDLLWMLKWRHIRENKNYDLQSISATLDSLFSYLDWIEDTNIDVNCDITDIVDWWEYDNWESVYNILRDLLSNQYEFKIIPKVDWKVFSFELIVWNEIWEDKTNPSEPNYLQYKINLNNNKKWNIAWLSWVIDFNYFANYVIGEQNWTFTSKENSTSISEIWTIEKSIKVNNNLQDDTQWYLDWHSDLLKWLNIDTFTLDYNEAEIWDKVKIIAIWNKLLELDDDLILVKKKFNLKEIWWIKFTFNKTKILKKTFFENFSEIKNKVL